MYVCIYAVSITKVMQNICCITRKVFNEFIFLLPFKKHTQRQGFSRFPQVNLRRKQNVRQAKGRRNINMQLNVLPPELLKIYNKS